MSSPQTIAIIGASNDRSKYGNMAVRVYRDQGFIVYPVHPKEAEVEGIKAYASVLDIPGDVETASVYLPPSITFYLLEDLKAKEFQTIFLNPGSSNARVMERSNDLGLNVVEACSIIAAGKTPEEYR